jgi:aspartate racemase
MTKTIGLLGGMSWESTAHYYREINLGIKAQLGGLHSAKLAMYSVDFAEIERLQHQGDWQATAEILSNAAKHVEAAGAECLLICTNTMHKVADTIEASIAIPLIHIADATAEKLIEMKVNKVGLLGTSFTMEQDFYKGRLKEKHGLDVIVPNQTDRQMIHEVIYQELCLGKVNQASKQKYLAVIEKLKQSGADAVILGCTEIGLLVNQTDTTIPLLDTTLIHAHKAVQFALSD